MLFHGLQRAAFPGCGLEIQLERLRLSAARREERGEERGEGKGEERIVGCRGVAKKLGNQLRNSSGEKRREERREEDCRLSSCKEAGKPAQELFGRGEEKRGEEKVANQLRYQLRNSSSVSWQLGKLATR